MTTFAGTAFPPGMHVLADFWDAQGLDDLALVQRALGEAATACGATLLEIRLHQFGEQGGVTGVALLAESHISIHTWPESGYAALDVFVCGNCDPHKAVEQLKSCFLPARFNIISLNRGRESD